MATIITPNMSLVVPVPGVEPGPQYANDLNASLTLIDQHNHTPGFGVQIPPDGLDINADLTFQGNNATDIRSIRFTPQSAPLAVVTDVSSLYAVTETGSNGDLWFNDASKTPIQITKSGAVLATISELVSGSNTAGFVANQLVVQSAPNTPGNIVVGSVLLGNNTAGSNFLTLQPPNAMSASYSLTLPSTPSSTSIVTLDTSGNFNTVSTTGIGFNPSGAIIMFGGTSIPAGYLLCDGTSYLRTDQPTLYTAIGSNYGSADGAHFNVPDFRGLFPRGVTGASANDPDATSRTAANTGGNTGNNIGSQQVDSLTSHVHDTFNSPTGGGSNPQIINGAHGTTTADFFQSQNASSLAGSTVTSTETRPKNLYVNFIIKT